MSKSTTGGAAAAGGMDFQHRVAAWLAVHVLAEKDTSLPWRLPSDVTLESIRCETEQPVDDVLVCTSVSGVCFLQVKKTLRLSSSGDSELASTVDQFVRQFVACRASSTGGRPWERPLNPATDRLVLLVGADCYHPIRVHL